MIIASIVRNWPFANGSGRLIDKYARGIDLGKGERVVRTSDGFYMHVFADDLIGRHLILSGKFDRSVAQILLDQSTPGDILLDIGANIVYYSALFLKKVENSHCICFEPQPGITDILLKNVGQFEGRAVVRPVGLGDSTDTLRFLVNEGNRGGSKFSPEGQIEVEVLEARRALADIPRADLIKIDVEGFEERIFRNAEEEFRRLRPRAILLEDQNGLVAPDGEIGRILCRLGYEVFGIKKTLFGTDLVRIKSKADCIYNDYVAKSIWHNKII